MARSIKHNRFDSTVTDQSDSVNKLQNNIDLVENQAIVNETAINAIDSRVTTLEGATTSVDFSPAVFTASTGPMITASDTQLTVDTTTIANANYSLASNAITVGEAGLYMISFNFTITSNGTSGSTYASYIIKMKVDGVELPTSVTGAWVRESNTGSPYYVAGTNSFIVQLSAGAVLTFFGQNFWSFLPESDNIQDRSQVSLIKLQ